MKLDPEAMRSSAMTRRTLVVKIPTLVATAGTAGALWAVPGSSWAANAVKKTSEFGGGGGDPFQMEHPNSIGLRAAGRVDALVLNGRAHGGGGGDPVTAIALDRDDYWSEFEVHSGAEVDYVRFKSKHGFEVSGGGGGGDRRVSLKGVRLLRIGGRAGGRVDQLRFEYIENYQPSLMVDGNATAVLDFKPGGQTISTYTDKSLQTTEAYERITESAREFTLNTSAEGEYFAKFSVSTGLKLTDSSKETVRRSSEQALKSGEKVERALPADQAAFLISLITIMKDSDGRNWIYPNAPPNWIVLKEGNFKQLNGLYDLTSGASTQIGFNVRMVNGYRMLVAPG